MRTILILFALLSFALADNVSVTAGNCASYGTGNTLNVDLVVHSNATLPSAVFDSNINQTVPLVFREPSISLSLRKNGFGAASLDVCNLGPYNITLISSSSILATPLLLLCLSLLLSY